MQKIIPIIMAGGSGTRLWPVSRDSFPKQFISLLDHGLSTFQTTLQRVSGPIFDTPIVIAGQDVRFIVADQMQHIGLTGEIVLEPERRDSAAAVAVGTALALLRNKDAICLVLAADHIISNNNAFVEDCIEAANCAAEGMIMTLGITPSTPSTGYGYLRLSSEKLGLRGNKLAQFVEKPDIETADQYVREGLLWNSGNFVFKAETMAQEMQEFAPDVLEAARGAVEKAQKDLDFLRLDAATFSTARKVSIDYAIMEKTSRAGVVSANFGWSDVGSWDSLFDVKDKDEYGNVFEGRVKAIDTKGTFVRSDSILTTVIGIEDAIIVTTSDAVLVASRKAAGQVKNLVDLLKEQKHPEASEHLRIFRPWGWYQRIDIGARFQVKRINVKPGGILSLQKHFHRAEHWVVVKGTAEVTLDSLISLVHENESIYLPIGCHHRLANRGKIDLELIEVQVGSHTGEDDIVRLEDVYARK